jgi:hypothetical protein
VLVLRVLGVSNIRLRAWVAVGMTVVAFVTVFGSELLATHHSNACDPGLARFKALQSDPALQSKPGHAFIEFEWDQPDNGLLGCSWSYITYVMLGPDKHAIYAEANALLVSNGWSHDPPIPGMNFEGHEKQSSYGLLTAIVSEDVAWVDLTVHDSGGPVTTP